MGDRGSGGAFARIARSPVPLDARARAHLGDRRGGDARQLPRGPDRRRRGLLSHRGRACAQPAGRALHQRPAAPAQGGLLLQEEGMGERAPAVRRALRRRGRRLDLLLRPRRPPRSTSRRATPNRERSTSRSRRGRRWPTRTASSARRRWRSTSAIPSIRMLLNPITDESSRLVGLAGMVLDAQHLREEGAAGSGQEISAQARGRPAAADRHGARRARARDPLRRRPRPPTAGPDDVRGRLGFVFADWEVGTARPARDARFVGAAQLRAQPGALAGCWPLLVVGGVGFALRAAAREMKLSAMKSDFVSNVSHELRTPLASIRVFGELLRLGTRRDAGEDARVRRVHRDREPAADPADQQHPRLLAHRVRPARATGFEPADLEAVVEETLRTFRPSLEQAGFRLGFETPASRCRRSRSTPGDRPGARQPARQRRQVLGRRARDRGRDCAARATWAVVSVRDHGIGIPREEQKQDLRALPPRLDRAGARRQGQRPRPRDRAPHRRGARRPGRGRERPGEGSTFSSLRRWAGRAGAHRDAFEASVPGLIVEDDEAMSVALRDGFASEGYDGARWRATARQGLRARARRARPTS